MNKTETIPFFEGKNSWRSFYYLGFTTFLASFTLIFSWVDIKLIADLFCLPNLGNFWPGAIFVGGTTFFCLVAFFLFLVFLWNILIGKVDRQCFDRVGIHARFIMQYVTIRWREVNRVIARKRFFSKRYDIYLDHFSRKVHATRTGNRTPESLVRVDGGLSENQVAELFDAITKNVGNGASKLELVQDWRVQLAEIWWRR